MLQRGLLLLSTLSISLTALAGTPSYKDELSISCKNLLSSAQNESVTLDHDLEQITRAQDHPRNHVTLYRSALGHIFDEIQNSDFHSQRTVIARLLYKVGEGISEISSSDPNELYVTYDLVYRFVLNQEWIGPEDQYLFQSAMIAGLGEKGFAIFPQTYAEWLDHWLKKKVTPDGIRATSFDPLIAAEFNPANPILNSAARDFAVAYREQQMALTSTRTLLDR